MSATITNTLGKIEYSNSVLGNIAGLAAMECYGIVGMSPMKASDGIVNLLKKENLDKGVRVTANGDTISVELFTMVKYGIAVAAVATNVIDAVKYALESTTGLKVESVNVTVMGIRV